MIESYLALINQALQLSPFVYEPTVSIEERGNKVWFIRANVYFVDNSMLHFRELLIAQENDLEKRAYTYHYQRSDGQMVFRYDNSTHYPNLSSAPHHKHIEDGAVIASSMPDLVSVLREIEGFVRSM